MSEKAPDEVCLEFIFSGDEVQDVVLYEPGTSKELMKDEIFDADEYIKKSLVVPLSELEEMVGDLRETLNYLEKVNDNEKFEDESLTYTRIGQIIQIKDEIRQLQSLIEKHKGEKE